MRLLISMTNVLFHPAEYADPYGLIAISKLHTDFTERS